MSIFNQMIRGATCEPISQYDSAKTIGKPRTLRETIQDQITSLQARIADLEAVEDWLITNSVTSGDLQWTQLNHQRPKKK